MNKKIAISYIRFSTPTQSRGDSYRRQMEAAKRYCQEQGLELEDNILLDAGVSGFRGDNLRDGALGLFIEQVQKGLIPSDVTLIIESLDRLSRMEVGKALRLLLEVVDLGVTIVTLIDGQVYTKGLDTMQLMLSLAVMSRAHEESLTKSKRLGAVWGRKKEEARAGAVVTQMIPAWLRIVTVDGEQRFEVIEEKAEAVRAAFEFMAQGHGRSSTVRRLNEAGLLNPKGLPWAETSIGRLIEQGAVIGRYQPHIGKAHNRKPIGDEIPDYYPRIISDELYWKVYHQSKNNRNSKASRGDSFSNLFSTLAVCECCGSGMRYQDKGKPTERYLVCSSRQTGRGCQLPYMNYGQLEKVVLISLVKHKHQLLRPQDEVNPVEVAALKGRLEKSQESLRNVAEAIAALGFSEALKVKHQALAAEEKDLKAQIKKAEEVAPKLPEGDQLEELARRILDVNVRRQLHRVLQQIGFRLSVGIDCVWVNEHCYRRRVEHRRAVWSGDDGLHVAFGS
ncbi:recombinase family protein [Shewanella zhangzhouensis]|uniref:recombinase family protein n=1 Tax=Shewanella zhangzhouensis TaxID=2864213 RepID=UPI001C657D4B|nr:recombinase family protein [Shewanella zhangzhouensis]QYK04917.1 recombinase family protein [Shewanella zhangzhouensis]